MNTPQTDTPVSDAPIPPAGFDPFLCMRSRARTLERRAIAAEAKLAKWESELSRTMPADFKDWWQNSPDEWPEVARMVIEGLRKQVEMTDKAAEARVKELETALHLRPIAEAGPVPDGAERLYATIFTKREIMAGSTQFPQDTHFIDIYPPQQ